MSEWLNKLQFPELANFGLEEGSKDEFEQYFERMETSPTSVVDEEEALGLKQVVPHSTRRSLQITKLQSERDEPKYSPDSKKIVRKQSKYLAKENQNVVDDTKPFKDGKERQIIDADFSDDLKSNSVLVANINLRLHCE